MRFHFIYLSRCLLSKISKNKSQTRTSPLKMRPKSAKIYRVMSKAAFLFLLQICFSGGCRAKRFDIEKRSLFHEKRVKLIVFRHWVSSFHVIYEFFDQSLEWKWYNGLLAYSKNWRYLFQPGSDKRYWGLWMSATSWRNSEVL